MYMFGGKKDGGRSAVLYSEPLTRVRLQVPYPYIPCRRPGRLLRIAGNATSKRPRARSPIDTLARTLWPPLPPLLPSCCRSRVAVEDTRLANGRYDAQLRYLHTRHTFEYSSLYDRSTRLTNVVKLFTRAVKKGVFKNEHIDIHFF